MRIRTGGVGGDGTCVCMECEFVSVCACVCVYRGRNRSTIHTGRDLDSSRLIYTYVLVLNGGGQCVENNEC